MYNSNLEQQSLSRVHIFIIMHILLYPAIQFKAIKSILCAHEQL